MLLFVLLIGLGALIYFLTQDKSLYEADIPRPVERDILQPAVFDDPLPEAIIETRRETINCAVESGETITNILGNYFSASEILEIAQKAKPVFPLHRLCAGHGYSIELEEDAFISFRYDIDSEEQLIIEKKEGEISIRREPIQYDIEIESIGTEIDSSLFGSVAAIGESSQLAITIMDIFAWDIDFIRDIREGDYFSAIVEKRYRNGKLEGYGNVLAAHFNNQGEDFYAFYFANDGSGGYYNEHGQSLRKAFLKAPLSYTRISSGYTNRRYHPVLNEWRPHLAVDYAAPTGTPVKAIADGTVMRKSYDRNNGNLIRLRHPNAYESTYIHLSRFGRGIKKGTKVKQGDIIGYVGSTGLATGPHLDFRIFHNGKPINPLKIKSTPAEPIASHNKDEFAETVAMLRERLSLKSEQIQASISSTVAALKDDSSTPTTL
jgi:murein DD-endopeptidase MepM/ murein hydrolase activator NlpD